MFTGCFYFIIAYLTITLNGLHSRNFIMYAQENLFSNPEERFKLQVSNIQSGSAMLSWTIPPEKLDYIRALRMNCTRTQSQLEPYLQLHDKHVILNPTIATPNIKVTPLESASKYSCVLIGAVSLSVGADDRLVVLSEAVTFTTPIDSAVTVKVPSASNTKAIVLVTVVPFGIVVLTVVFMGIGYYLHKRRLRMRRMEDPGEEPLLANLDSHKKKKADEDYELDKENRPLRKNTNHSNSNTQRKSLLLTPAKKYSDHKRSDGRDSNNRNYNNSSNAQKHVHQHRHRDNVRNSNTQRSYKPKDRYWSSEHHYKASKKGGTLRLNKHDYSIEIEERKSCDMEMVDMEPSSDLKVDASRSTVTSTVSSSTNQSSVGLGVPIVTNTAIQRSFCSWPVQKETHQSSITCTSEDYNDTQARSMYTRTLSAPNITRKPVRRHEGLELPNEIYSAATKTRSHQAMQIEQ